MCAIVCVVRTLPTKKDCKSLNDKKVPVGKLFIYVQRSFSQNLRLLGLKIREL